MPSVADLIVSRLQAAGARAIFGVPGGGTNLDVIAAARRSGLPFVLAHTETGGAIMAAAQAEITGAPGVCLSTLGPGVSSLVNGIAHAWLDRVPLVVLTDAMAPEAQVRFAHQNLPHGELVGPITRFSAPLAAGAAEAILTHALTCALGPPAGPVHIDCVGGSMEAEIDPHEDGHARADADDRVALSDSARRSLASARRPLAIVGLGARDSSVAVAIRDLVERRGLPVLTTYKARGVIPDTHSLCAGLFTLGEIERPLVDSADLLLTIGLDPVELLPRPWPWAHPLVQCCGWRASHDQIPGGATIVGPLPVLLRAVDECLPPTVDWTPEAIADHRARQRAAVMVESTGLTPGRAMAVVAGASPMAGRVTVDAGAHMFPAMALLPAEAPTRILISNGLSTMGYAVPAAIGAALLEPREPVLAITGDAGLLMCLGELRTAARERLRVVVVVLADGELSLIRIKQDRRGLDPDGVRIGDMDWVRAGAALGLRSVRACDEAALEQHLADAMAGEGPALVEVRVDPSGYGPMLQRLRG